MRAIVLKYGLTAGGILAFVMLSTLPFTRDWMRKGYLEMVTIASFVIALSAVFFGIRAYHRQAVIQLSFGKMFIAGILITLVAATINSLTWEFCYQTAMKDFPELFVERNMQRLREAGKTEAEVAVEILPAKELMSSYDKNLALRFFLSFTEILPLGVLFSLASAIIFRMRSKWSTLIFP